MLFTKFTQIYPPQLWKKSGAVCAQFGALAQCIDAALDSGIFFAPKSR